MEYYNLVVIVRYPGFYNRSRSVESSYILMSSVNKSELEDKFQEVDDMIKEIIAKKSKISKYRGSLRTKIRYTLKDAVSYRLRITTVPVRNESSAMEEIRLIHSEVHGK